MDSSLASQRPVNRGTALEVLVVFLKLGLTSFGGPVAHIGYFRREFVEQRRWLDDETFTDLVGLCQFLPGPASSEVGFSVGLLRAGWLGAIAAWCAFTLPSVMLLLAFTAIAPNWNGSVARTQAGCGRGRSPGRVGYGSTLLPGLPAHGHCTHRDGVAQRAGNYLRAAHRHRCRRGARTVAMPEGRIAQGSESTHARVPGFATRQRRGVDVVLRPSIWTPSRLHASVRRSWYCVPSRRG